MIDPDHLLGLQIPTVTAQHTIRDTMLYALGLGLGADPCDPFDLRLVTETDLVAMPTMVLVLAQGQNWMTALPSGITYSGVVDGERSIRMHGPLPTSGVMEARSRVIDVIDKGHGRGALIQVERHILTEDGTPVATTLQTVFARADGGFGGAPRKNTPPPALPDREPDHQIQQSTLPRQALIYRLSGDYNPLHSDPAHAVAAGFTRPILHGLATFGIAAAAVIRASAKQDPKALRAISGRFSSPVYPGETLTTEIWETPDAIRFQVRAQSSGVIVLANGRAELD